MRATVQKVSNEGKVESFFFEEKNGQEVIREELLTSKAQEWAKGFLRARPPLHAAQLRRFYHDVKSLEAKVTSEEEFTRSRPLIKMLKSKVAYACPKTYGGRKVPWEFREFIEECVNKIDQLKDFQTFTLVFEAVVGYFYGEGTAETIEIGGMDNPIIKHPITQLPYIPGSSIKGKMRSLLEWKLDNFESNGEVHQYGGRKCQGKECPICRIFGTSSDKAQIGPSRLIVRDAFLTEDSQKRLEELKRKKGLMYVEEKTENTINRLSARSNPRTQERVPADTIFEFEMIYRVFDFDSDEGKVDEKLFDYVKEGIKLIQMDALGGSGSRGYGKVKIDYEVESHSFENSDEEEK